MQQQQQRTTTQSQSVTKHNTSAKRRMISIEQWYLSERTTPEPKGVRTQSPGA